MTDRISRALADAEPVVFWLDDPAAPDPEPPVTGSLRTDLAIVGGGYTGLWTALLAKERYPELDVVLLEANTCGWAASGRNGGFCDASLTHGFANGLARWPDELADLDRLGRANHAAIAATVTRLGIDCGWEPTGELTVATAPHHLAELAEEVDERRAFGHDVTLLDGPAIQAEVGSPTYLGALSDPTGTALVEPARLAWGLRRACLEAGVRIHEGTRVLGVRRDGAARLLRTATGSVRAQRVALATNAFPSLVRRLRRYTVPVYDLVLMTEPLSPDQLAAIGWKGRQGIGDASNFFHYYRLTRDQRILWGGYTPLYSFGSRIHPDLEQRAAIHRMLAEHFFTTFPQLDGLRFTHKWGGVIDTSTRFCAFFGTASAGRIGYALGYTGLGVGATRFGAEVMLDLLYDEATERTRLRLVRERPLPFPPEPLRSAGIQLTRYSMRHADTHGGRRNLWLRTLDRFGLGFDF
ncbi:glycine/D-amino acid oxidase-like deaminating enzyme [Kribbella amoyensis]|uniref:Glycine/D-amino acid oxidase-like deaminating enzyme n=1 Tax=Kribbella amoyensis TaxID=996641 RepID=A0A561BPC0_9ACTN|nr:FAD-dependent oxidoreductase [Kribbella amoyensis]TWD80716.1 glycine/D-amino acid oxidase-like deaminating enzyme [Kribbella amoyensis]